MNVEQLVSFLDSPTNADSWLHGLGLTDRVAGHANLVSMADHGITLDLLAVLGAQLARHLPEVGEPDLALSTLSRFVAASRNPLSFGSLVEDDPQALPVLLHLFSTSGWLGDLLVDDPASYDLIRMTEGQPVARESLSAEICGETRSLSDVRDLMLALRNFKRRETLRIAYGDIIQHQSTEVVSRQLAFLADAVCEAAVRFVRQDLEAKRGVPRNQEGHRANFVVIAIGRLGGLELDYESRIEVMFGFSGRGKTDGDRPMDSDEFCERLAKRVVEILGDDKELGVCYKLDISHSPAALRNRTCVSISEIRSHYDTLGRTWERQSLIKARPIAGDTGLGYEFLDAIEPWVYRRYLSRADITGTKALKRRLKRRTDQKGAFGLDVEGDVLDVEFIVQFLQLINGGDHREVRVGNTLRAIAQLEQTGCLTPEESQLLEGNYDWLRRVEHRLEIVENPPSNELPDASDNLRRLALRCGYVDDAGLGSKFRDEYQKRTQQNQAAINHLLEETFDDGTPTDAEVDLVLDPAPTMDQIASVLEPYGFRDTTDAYHHLFALSTERIPFLSTRRCRHFLAQISKPLLTAISQTPSPDATLANLCRVSDSLGGKGVLWQLFHQNSASLDLYVRLCSSSPYLTSILTRYPGMIDELMDSLMLASLPTMGELQSGLDDLCSKVEDIEPILHSFKNTQHLNVGVRELLGKADIRSATATLSDVAETCLQQIVQHEFRKLVRKYGQPRIGQSNTQCELIILAMGKFGGREPNYHSDIDVVFLYEAEGETYHPPTIRGRDTTTNQHFYSELGQRVVKSLTDHGPFGRLYDSDSRLRPTGPNGPVSVSIDEFHRFYHAEHRSLAETRALCQARPVFGSEAVRAKTADIVREILMSGMLADIPKEEIRAERLRTQATAGPRNLKRGPGGTLDIEFIAQVLQLLHAPGNPEILSTGTVDAITALADAKICSTTDAAALCDSYRFLRRVEARLRLLNTTARHDLPREADELAKLAYLLRFDRPAKLEAECARLTKQNRQLFDKLLT